MGIREDGGVIPIAVISLRADGPENIINPEAIHHGLLPETHFGRRPRCFVGALYSQVDRKRRKFIRAQCKIKRLLGIINSVIPFSRSIHFAVGRLNHSVTFLHGTERNCDLLEKREGNLFRPRNELAGVIQKRSK